MGNLVYPPQSINLVIRRGPITRHHASRPNPAAAPLTEPPNCFINDINGIRPPTLNSTAPPVPSVWEEYRHSAGMPEPKKVLSTLACSSVANVVSADDGGGGDDDDDAEEFKFIQTPSMSLPPAMTAPSTLRDSELLVPSNRFLTVSSVRFIQPKMTWPR